MVLLKWAETQGGRDLRLRVARVKGDKSSGNGLFFGGIKEEASSKRPEQNPLLLSLRGPVWFE